jgi:hypothetical protein
MNKFLEQHGTLAILLLLVLLGLGATFYVGVHMKIDAEKVFAYFAGFGMGAFSALTLAMRGAGTPTPPSTPPPVVDTTVKP